jgi:hypothetical protein
MHVKNKRTKRKVVLYIFKGCTVAETTKYHPVKKEEKRESNITASGLKLRFVKLVFMLLCNKDKNKRPNIQCITTNWNNYKYASKKDPFYSA